MTRLTLCFPFVRAGHILAPSLHPLHVSLDICALHLCISTTGTLNFKFDKETKKPTEHAWYCRFRKRNLLVRDLTEKIRVDLYSCSVIFFFFFSLFLLLTLSLLQLPLGTNDPVENGSIFLKIDNYFKYKIPGLCRGLCAHGSMISRYR